MQGEHDTEELRTEQLAREREERRLAEDAPRAEETAQHERRAEKAHYLREKLDERAESEREADESAGEEQEPAGGTDESIGADTA